MPASPHPSNLVEVITIGDELLIGQVVDTNSAWIGQRLNEFGLKINRIISVSDRREEILDAIRDSESRADVILLTGGLGPTKDDITKKCLCEYFDCELVFHPESFANVEKIFAARGKTVTPLNRGQAEVPSACEPLLNRLGTAPGMWFNRNGKVLVSLPGVPYEMKALVTEQVLPKLSMLFRLPPVLHKTILTQGIGESMLADMIVDFEENLPENIRLAYLPSPGLVRLRLTASGNDEAVMRSSLDKQTGNLVSLIEEHVYGYDDETLESLVGDLLRSKRLTVATAESCTGGYIAHRITSVPGSSEYFRGSVIAYDNDIKTSLLDVQLALINEKGAVSREVVEQMASNARIRLGADLAVATSGIAGPTGGSPLKPVGTVHIAVATKNGIVHRQLRLGDNRERNIREASLHALNLLRKTLMAL